MTDQVEAVKILCQYAAGYTAGLLLLAAGIRKVLDKWGDA